MSVKTPVAPLHRGDGARRHYLLGLRDRSEVTATLEVLSTLTNPELVNLRVLELAAGCGRLTLPLLAAGYEVVATETEPEALELLRLEVPYWHVRRLDTYAADMTSFHFDERFQAVVLSSFSVAQLTVAQRERTLALAAEHLAVGGVIIACTQYLLADAPRTASARLSAGARLRDEVKGHRRCLSLDWLNEHYTSNLHAVPPSWLSTAFSRLGMDVIYQHSHPDTTLRGRANAVVAAVKRS